jgi:hypothetical protein
MKTTNRAGRKAGKKSTSAQSATAPKNSPGKTRISLPCPHDIVFAHIALPDSMKERERVLRAMLAIVTARHPVWQSICDQIEALELLEKLQKEWPLDFSQSEGGAR